MACDRTQAHLGESPCDKISRKKLTVYHVLVFVKAKQCCVKKIYKFKFQTATSVTLLKLWEVSFESITVCSDCVVVRQSSEFRLLLSFKLLCINQ